MSKYIIKPNVVRGGIAIPLGQTNYYLMKGRKHSQGGIDIGKNPRTGLEVEDGEVMKMTKNGTRVFSAQPILNGISPASMIMRGYNPDKVFRAQEQFKDVNNLKDDGTKKAQYDKQVNNRTLSDAEYFDIMERVARENHSKWGESEDMSLLRILNDNSYDYRGYYNKYPNSKANADTHWTDEFKTVYHPTFSNESRYSGYKNKFNPDGIKGGTWLNDYFMLPSLDQIKSLKHKAMWVR